jgi:predicted enzyme related to lactoylglutathione lyase
MIRSLSLVELTVSDHAASLRWYRDLLGLTQVPPEESGRYAVLRAGDMRLSLKLGDASPGSVLLAFEVDDLALTLAELARQGITPEGPIKESPEGYRRALLRDPDGHRVSLFEWTGRASGP